MRSHQAYPVMKRLSPQVGDLTSGDLTPPGSDEGQVWVPLALLRAGPLPPVPLGDPPARDLEECPYPALPLSTV